MPPAPSAPTALVRIGPRPTPPFPRATREVTAPDAAPVPTLARGLLLALAVATVAVHVVVNRLSMYGLHRDELLYLAMGRHLQLFGMDMPPWMALLAEATRALVGETDVAIRLGPAIAHGLLVGLAGVFARELRGGHGAQLLAATAILASPYFLRTGHLFEPLVFDQLWWSLALLALVRIGRASYDGPPAARVPVAHLTETASTTASGRRRRVPWKQRAGAWLSHATSSPWFLLGVAGGMGLLTKFSIAFLGVGVAVALAVGPMRRALLTVRPWLALLTALVIGAPSLVGQMQLAFPVVSQLQDLRGAPLVQVGLDQFLRGQLLVGPALVLAAIGAWAILTARSMRAARTAGLACVLTFGLLLAIRGRAAYAAPIYPLLCAAGAVALANGVRRARLRHASPMLRLMPAGALVLIGGAVALPLAVPLLPPARTAAWAQSLGVARMLHSQGREPGFPHKFAEMVGWPELAYAVSEAFASLPAATRADVAVVAANYGEAGALDFYGRRLGLPGVVSAASSYAFFGAGDRVGDPLLTVGIPEGALAGHCARIVPMGRVAQPDSAWLLREERDVRLFLCEHPTPLLRAGWERAVAAAGS